MEWLVYGSGAVGAPSWPSQLVLTWLHMRCFVRRFAFAALGGGANETNATRGASSGARASAAESWAAAFAEANELAALDGAAHFWLVAFAVASSGVGVIACACDACARVRARRVLAANARNR